MRLRIDLAYDGGDFHGWASQPGLRTVQGELAAALTTSLRVPAGCSTPIGSGLRVVCAGRTDAGVHARGQVCHVDVPRDLVARASPAGPPALVRPLNGILADDVRVRSVAEAPAQFDARFSALSRRYVYRIADQAVTLDPLARGHVVGWPRTLDVGVMHGAAPSLLGCHDFAAFCKQRAGATTIRTLLALEVSRGVTGWVEITVVADAFCHSMVRSLAGCLVAVGEGRRAPSWPAEVLVAGARGSDVTVAPARGLTLEEVTYPAERDLAARTERTRARRRSDEVDPAGDAAQALS